MANIPLQKRNGGERQSLARYEMDPFRLMRDLFHWDPFREIGTPWQGQELFTPHFDVKETKDAFVFTADLPGIKESDLEVNVDGSRLTVSGKREAEKEDKGDTYFTYERSFGNFSRSFTLPDSADTGSTKAELKNGVLTLVVPKKPGATPKKIQVGASNTGKT